MPTSGISRRHSRTRSFMSSSVTGVAQSGRAPRHARRHSGIVRARSRRRARRHPASARSRRRDSVAAPRARLRPALAGRVVGDLGDLAAVVARVRHEVLEDHLLDVAVAGVDLGERLQRGDPLLLGLADPDQDPARERDPELARPPRSSRAAAPGAWSASRRGRSPSAALRSTRASAPATRSPRAAGPGRARSGRRGSCAAAARARARARRPRRRRRRSRRGPRSEAARPPPG